MKLFVFRLKTP